MNDPPLVDDALMGKLVAVSSGVFEGDNVAGVRYPAPEHMSGWYLTTQRYNGDIGSLTLHHLGHIIEARPDLARYLGLPPGYCFNSADGVYWFDHSVADEPSE